MITPEPTDAMLVDLAVELTRYIAMPCADRREQLETRMASYLVATASPTALSIRDAVRENPGRFDHSTATQVRLRGDGRRRGRPRPTASTIL